MRKALLFLLPSFLVLSCNESKAPTEPAVTQQQPASGKAPQINMLKVQPRETNIATSNLVSAMHDPKVVGSKVQCFSGTTDGGFNGTCRRTTLANRDLAELDTFDGDGDPSNAYAGVWAVPVNIRGKRLGDVQELRFSYAGGPATGGTPRWSVAIDENGNGRHEFDPFDPTSEQYAFADAQGCNDGDTFVGTEDAEDDGSCTWSYKAETFPNWDSFAGAHPSYRIARLFSDGSTGFVPAFVIIDQPAHYLVYQLNVN